MTYNVRYASDRPPNSWPQRQPVARAMLAKYDADIIGMQEAVYRQVKDFDAMLTGHDWIGLGRDGGSRGEFMAVFYRRQRLEPLAYDHFWLSDTPDRIGSTTWGNTNRRMVTWVKFRDKKTATEFYFWNTHLDHRLQTAREKSADLIAARIRQQAKQESAAIPLILTGDFNAVAEQNKVYQRLVRPDLLSDTWKMAAKRSGDVGTFHGYRPPRKDAGRIDWILASGPVKVLHSEIVTYKSSDQYPSDHFPVLADVVLGLR